MTLDNNTPTPDRQETQPVSALEKKLWEYASWNSQTYEQERTGNADERRGRQDAFRQAAITVHERDAQLWALVKVWEARAKEQSWGENAIPLDANPYARCAAELAIALEGKLD